MQNDKMQKEDRQRPVFLLHLALCLLSYLSLSFFGSSFGATGASGSPEFFEPSPPSWKRLYSGAAGFRGGFTPIRDRNRRASIVWMPFSLASSTILLTFPAM